MKDFYNNKKKRRQAGKSRQSGEEKEKQELNFAFESYRKKEFLFFFFC
jgi:hypothetical protein